MRGLAGERGAMKSRVVLRTRLSVTWSVELLTGHLLIRRFDERVVLEVGRQGGEGTEPLSW